MVGIPPQNPSDSLVQHRDRIIARGGKLGTGEAIWWTIGRLFWREYVFQAFWMLVEIGIRLVSPYLLRQYMRWILVSPRCSRRPPTLASVNLLRQHMR